MSYNKQTWATGETITAEKLNHIEDGIADNAVASTLVVHINADGNGDPTMDKTWQEIYDALESGAIVVCPDNANENGVSLYMFMYAGEQVGTYIVKAEQSADIAFTTNSSNGYPKLQNG